MNKTASFRSLLSAHKLSILLGLFALSVVDLAQISIPMVVERVVDLLTAGNARAKEIAIYAVYFLIIGLIMGLFGFFWRYFLLGAARKIEYTLRNEYFSHLQSLDFNFFSKRTVGDLMARNVNDIEAIRGACGLGLIVGFEGIFLF
ncbi:MAG: ABC transporter transmembrane domain-containing protein, partial [Thermodesulfobacteriota bacterium]